jgi:hypothetical protein
MFVAHLHALGRDGPQRRVKVEFCPPCAACFAGPGGGQDQQPQGVRRVGSPS